MTTKKPILIKASIKALGRFYTAEGKTVEETLLNLKPPIARDVGVLTLTKGDLSSTKILQPRLVAGLWGKLGKTMEVIALKNIKLLFSNFDD